MRETRLATIDNPLLEPVVELHKRNAKTLGFMPRKAFWQAIKEDRLLVHQENEHLAGYLLFGRNHRAELIYITHLCVADEMRGKGISRSLVEKLIEITQKHYRGIRVRCRRDYSANEIWTHLGFSYKGDHTGRGADKHPLSIWWKDYGHPDLFTETIDETGDLLVVLDTNVVITQLEGGAESEGEFEIISEHLGIEFCVTPEIRNEIQRNDDAEQRAKHLSAVSAYSDVRPTNFDSKPYIASLDQLYPANKNRQDESDIKHIEHSLNAGANAFVTNDEKLINRVLRSRVSEELDILRPWEIVSYVDELRDATKYNPSLLAGCDLSIRQARIEDLSVLSQVFKKPMEKTKDFRNRMKPYFENRDRFIVSVVEDDKNPIALYVVDHDAAIQGIKCPLIQIGKNRIGRILTRHILKRFIEVTLEKGLMVTLVSDTDFINEFEIEALSLGYRQTSNGLMKISVQKSVKSTHLEALLNEFQLRIPSIRHIPIPPSDELQQNNPASVVYDFYEHVFWPLKILDAFTPCYLVPIKPDWALHLFDSRLASRTLFGADRDLILQTDNVYYCRSNLEVEAPARILWYVSKWQQSVDGTMSIRAASKLNLAEKGKAKNIFKKYRRLGIFGWDDVLDMTDGDPNAEISAYVFSQTELLPYPIMYGELKGYWTKELGKNFSPRSTQRIENKVFDRLYQSGVELEQHI